MPSASALATMATRFLDVLHLNAHHDRHLETHPTPRHLPPGVHVIHTTRATRRAFPELCTDTVLRKIDGMRGKARGSRRDDCTVTALTNSPGPPSTP
jgi:hypothetical protein